MNQEELKEILEVIDITDFLDYEGVKVQDHDGTLKGTCPFCKSKDTLYADPKLLSMQCLNEGCGFKGQISDFIRKKYNCRNGQIFDHLKKYKTKRIDGYEIITLNRHEIMLKISSRTYQLTRFKLYRLTDFSMTIKLTDRKGFDCWGEVNLARIKSRNDFAREVSDTLYISEDTIRKDLRTIMKAIEALQRQQVEQKEAESSSMKVVFQMTQTEEKQALDHLANRDLLEDLVKDTEKIGYVGDVLGKKVLYTSATSRLLDRPINVVTVGNSGGGKSYAQLNILSLFPDDEVSMHTRLTPKAISHFSRNELCHKILAIDEINGMEEEAMTQVRSLLSQGKISTAYTHVDRLSGRMEAMRKEVLGPVALFTSTTNLGLLDEETRSRFIILPVDESTEQTARVCRSLISQHTKRGIKAQREWEKVARKYKAIQKCLRPVNIIIPDTLARHITFNDEKVMYKRAFKGYLSIIFSLATQRQYQRKKYFDTDADGLHFETIYVEKRDIIDANDIVLGMYGSLLPDLNPVNTTCLNMIVEHCKEKAKGTQKAYHEITFTRRDIRQFTGWEQRPLRRSLEVLLDMEYLVKVQGRERSRHYYKLNADDPHDPVKINVWKPKI